MEKLSIKVSGLSKRYRIGLMEEKNETLIGSFLSFLAKPFKNFKKIKSLTDFSIINDDVFWALKNVNFEVKRGEVLGVIGHNGAGKSTLLKIISQITPPTEGEIHINGRIASLLEVGTGFHPDLTGEENIYLNGTILGMSKKEVNKKFDEIVRFSGIDEFIYTPVKRYSSGMRVRLAFSVAAHLEPEILLIDEVLAVGDAGFQQKCIGKMESISKTGRTILFVSHNMAAITQLTNRCIYLKNGKLFRQGNSDEMVRLYLSDTSRSESKHEKNKRNNNKPVYINDVAILTNKKEQTKIINEKSLFYVRVEFEINEQIENFQYGCSIVRQDLGAELFTTPSSIEKRALKPGKYFSELKIDPNYFNSGIYSINIKTFANFKRIERVRNMVSFRIVSGYDESVNNYQRWINGPLSFNYTISNLKKT